jgi:hypothetical protein
LPLYAVFEPDDVGFPFAFFGFVEFDEGDDLRIDPIFRAGVWADGVEAGITIVIQYN